jgi:hypothetical protein
VLLWLGNTRHVTVRGSQFIAMKQAKTPNAARFYCKYKYVIEIDESHLNRAKPGSLTRINYGSW